MAESTTQSGQPVSPTVAAERTQRRERTAVDLPVVGHLPLPHPEDLAFYAGLGVLGVLELIEWPVVVALAAGHVLLRRSHSRMITEFGEALEEA
jgi:hypothetical protein